MGLINQIRNKPKNVLGAVNGNLMLQLQKDMFQNQIQMCEDGVDADELPNAQGEFGLSLSNPIPCRSILGGRSYLDRLRTPDGTKIIYKRIGSFFSEVSPHPIDAYIISRHNGVTLETIYISAYQKRISGKCPKNLILADDIFN